MPGRIGRCGSAWHAPDGRASGRADEAEYRRRQFRWFYFIILAWLAYGVAQGSAALIRWIGGPAVTSARGLQLPLLLIVAACAIVAVALLIQNIGSPLGDILSASERVATGDLTTRVREHGAPWVRAVARAFNSMTTKLESQNRQRRALMADVAHELRTPLTAMQGRLEGMVDGIYPTDPAHVAQVLDDTRMLARLVEDLRTLAHSEEGTLALQHESTDLGALAEDAAAQFRPAADIQRIRITATVADDIPALDVDPVRIREVLANLVSNAVRYTPAGGEVRVDVEPLESVVAMRVSDTGPGISPADLPHIFDRFYKGTSSNGSGLGLTIARNLVMAHGGTLTARNSEAGGTVFTASLPIVNRES